MSKQTYPQYQLQTWADVTVSPIRKFYGIDIRRDCADGWNHLAKDDGPLFFDDFYDAQAELKALRKSARAAISKATGSPIVDAAERIEGV